MKTVIWKRSDGVYCTTNSKNYYSYVWNARQIHEMRDFKSAAEIIEAYMKWYPDGDGSNFIVIDP